MADELNDRIFFYFHDLEKSFIEKNKIYYLKSNIDQEQEIFKVKVSRLPSRRMKMTRVGWDFLRTESKGSNVEFHLEIESMEFTMLESPDKKSPFLKWLKGGGNVVENLTMNSLEFQIITPWNNKVVKTLKIISPVIERLSCIQGENRDFLINTEVKIGMNNFFYL